MLRYFHAISKYGQLFPYWKIYKLQLAKNMFFVLFNAKKKMYRILK